METIDALTNLFVQLKWVILLTIVFLYYAEQRIRWFFSGILLIGCNIFEAPRAFFYNISKSMHDIFKTRFNDILMSVMVTSITVFEFLVINTYMELFVNDFPIYIADFDYGFPISLGLSFILLVTTAVISKNTKKSIYYPPSERFFIKWGTIIFFVSIFIIIYLSLMYFAYIRVLELTLDLVLEEKDKKIITAALTFFIATASIYVCSNIEKMSWVVKLILVMIFSSIAFVFWSIRTSIAISYVASVNAIIFLNSFFGKILRIISSFLEIDTGSKKINSVMDAFKTIITPFELTEKDMQQLKNAEDTLNIYSGYNF